MEISDPKSAADYARQRMTGNVEHVRQELAGVRTGRASIGILDSVSVEAYGSQLPLNQVASLSIPEPTLIVASPFDPSQIASIERAIRNANLGLNPSNDGKVIRIPIPPLTTERRKELSKVVHQLTEEGRNNLRQVRRETNDALKKLLRDHELGEDDERRALDTIQTLTDTYVHQIDELQTTKDAELLE